MWLPKSRLGPARTIGGHRKSHFQLCVPEIYIGMPERSPGRETQRGGSVEVTSLHVLNAALVGEWRWKITQCNIWLPFSNSQNKVLWISNVPWSVGERLPRQRPEAPKVSGNLFIPWFSKGSITVRNLGQLSLSDASYFAKEPISCNLINSWLCCMSLFFFMFFSLPFSKQNIFLNVSLFLEDKWKDLSFCFPWLC